MNHLDTAGLKNKYYLIFLRMYEENKYMFLTFYSRSSCITYSTNNPRFNQGSCRGLVRSASGLVMYGDISTVATHSSG